MIKKMRDTFQDYMIRPMMYQCGTRISIALVLCLLWDRFINVQKYFSMLQSAFFVVAMVMFMLAWFQYLRFDGIRPGKLFFGTGKKKKKKHVTKSIVDFADEKIISFSELEDEEKILVRLFGDIICGLIFLIISVVAMLVL